MNREARIDSLTLSIARVTPTTHWTFVEMVDDQNRRGVGEATLMRHDNELLREANELFASLLNMSLDEVDLLLESMSLDTLARAAVVSALSHASTDLRGQSLNCTAADLLGKAEREFIPLYANINRRTRSRQPGDFAESAKAATAAGFAAIKIAPFDEVALYGAQKNVEKSLIDAGLERIAAVRDAVGPSIELMVDCHWRLNSAVARDVLASEVCNGLYWFECPLPETPGHLKELRFLRSFANDRGIRLAGCEESIRVDGFRPFIEAGAYDVMMPDAKYAGGVAEMLDIARLLDAHGIEFSPHNPSGPVAHAVSLQICSLVPNFKRLEVQFDETPLFDALAGTPLLSHVNGRSRVLRASGIGISLDSAVLDSLTIRRLKFNRQSEKRKVELV